MKQKRDATRKEILKWWEKKQKEHYLVFGNFTQLACYSFDKTLQKLAAEMYDFHEVLKELGFIEIDVGDGKDTEKCVGFLPIEEVQEQFKFLIKNLEKR